MVKISICGMCIHNYDEKKQLSCPAFPDGRTNYEDLFPYADVECGNGVMFSPKPEFKSIWDKSMYECFSKNVEHDDFEIVVP